MCDYSLEGHKSRPAAVGDKLEIFAFHGFCARPNMDVAVCLRPGTELAMEMTYARMDGSGVTPYSGPARFRQVNMEIKNRHHDAVELATGEVVLLAMMQRGGLTKATVLQLPVENPIPEPAEPAQMAPPEPVAERPKLAKRIRSAVASILPS